MRSIKFVSSVSGMTKIFVDGKELNTAIDTAALRVVRMNKSKLPPATGQNIIDVLFRKLSDDILNLDRQELSTIINFVKEEINF